MITIHELRIVTTENHAIRIFYSGIAYSPLKQNEIKEN